MTMTIRFNLPPDAAPEGHLLHGWEPEFEITGELIPLITATRNTPAEGGGVEISRVDRICPDCRAHRRGEHCRICEGDGAMLCHLLETNMPLRLSIEELLLEAAGARAKGMRESA